MSTGARWTIASIGAICAISFAIVALIVPSDAMNRTGLWCMAGFCTLIAVSCFPGPFQKIAIRLIAATVFLVYLAYILSEIGKPLPTPGTYRRSDTNLINAVIGFIVFGLPAGWIAIFGFPPRKRVGPQETMMMDESQFWKIIEAGGADVRKDQGRQREAIREQLDALAPEDLIEFQGRFYQKLGEANIWTLWGAASLIDGSGWSDDGFYYFRAWLISCGEAAYTNAVRDPDSLADIIEPKRDDCEYEFEDLLYLALEAYASKTGEEMPDIAPSTMWEVKGERWNFDDSEEMSRRLPRLSNLF